MSEMNYISVIIPVYKSEYSLKELTEILIQRTLHWQNSVFNLIINW